MEISCQKVINENLKKKILIQPGVCVCVCVCASHKYLNKQKL